MRVLVYIPVCVQGQKMASDVPLHQFSPDPLRQGLIPKTLLSLRGQQASAPLSPPPAVLGLQVFMMDIGLITWVLESKL